MKAISKLIIKYLIVFAIFMLLRMNIEIIDLLAGKEKVYDTIVSTVGVIAGYAVLFRKKEGKEI